MVEREAVCVYQFKAAPRGVSPMVWRRILLRSDQTIADLHYSIQVVMGWSDSHLHRFHIHGKDYGSLMRAASGSMTVHGLADQWMNPRRFGNYRPSSEPEGVSVS